jgi:hypothetical protein
MWLLTSNYGWKHYKDYCNIFLFSKSNLVSDEGVKESPEGSYRSLRSKVIQGIKTTAED